MLALRLDYLTGRAIATAYNDRGGAEWPPHPARVYSALVATWAEQDPLNSPEADAERAVLEWLERQEPPALAFEEGHARTVMKHFVPVNDGKVSGDGFSVPRKFGKADFENLDKLFGQRKGRQERTFPSLALPDTVIHLCWSCTVDPIYQPALNRLAARLVRVGHSSSFVHARWVVQAPEPSWIPHERGELLLRVVSPGQFARLSDEYQRHRGVEPRVLPFRAQRYRAAGDLPAVEPDDARHFVPCDWIILKRIGGPSLPLTRAADLATAVRSALMRHADQPVAELISGHAADGQPGRSPHLVVLSLAHVGHRHADGAIKGVALLLPRALDDAGRRPVLRALGRWEEQARKESGEAAEDAPTLKLGLRDGPVLEVQRQVWGDPGLLALREATWCEAATEWMSVTPVALDRNPGDLRHADAGKREAAFRAAAESIATACANVGLPQPEAVTVLPSGTWPGGAKAAQFPAYPPEPGKLLRVKVHARIRFARAVNGPVVLGAGRFQGLGLFRPVTQESAP